MQHAIVDGRANIRKQMEKDGHHSIELHCGPAPSGKVSLLNGQLEARGPRRVAGAFDADGRKVDGVHAESLLGQPQTVASVTVAGDQNRTAGGEAMQLSAEISVGLVAINGL